MIEKKLFLASKWKKMGIEPKIIQAFLDIPRENFVPRDVADQAYEDHPLCIGSGQTISQPTTVVMMLKWLDPKPESKVLEIGTGSGYNAALLSKLSKEVISIERIPELANEASKRLKELKISNVKVIVGDGKKGFPPKSPYDRIIVTAAAKEGVPEELENQLSDGGKIVIPVGDSSQKMLVGIKQNGKIKYFDMGDFVFVPLV